MGMVQPKLDKDIDPMPRNEEVSPLASPNQDVKQVPSIQGDTKILDDSLEVDMHNISFDVPQHRVL